jgi:hypothetical protein
MTTSEIQAAIASAIRKLIESNEAWATASDGTEFNFSIDRQGAIAVYLTDEDGEEQEYCFRLEITED